MRGNSNIDAGYESDPYCHPIWGQDKRGGQVRFEASMRMILERVNHSTAVRAGREDSLCDNGFMKVNRSLYLSQ